MPFSMTGFGAAEGSVAGGHLRVEIRTVNHRFFNPAFKLPSDLAALELELRERLRKEFARGHVAVSMRWVNGGQAQGGLQLNVDRAREAMARLRELQTAVGISGEISLDLLARQMDVLTVSNGESVTVSWEEVEPIVGNAATACRAMRRREGDALATELRQRLSELAKLTREIDARAPERLVQERDRLRASVAELLDGRVVDELRLNQELAFLAEKLDITEELVRLKAHYVAVEHALGTSGAVGKQLGFLVQEMGREINTVGSKAGDAAIAQAVIAMKGELEKIREQVENLE